MSFLRRLNAGLRRLTRTAAADQDLSDEVDHYLRLAAREHAGRGLSPHAAERAARVELGGVEAVKEQVRAGGWEAGIEALWRDLRYASRLLWRNPGFTLVAVASLGLGIGANSAIFSLVNAALIRHLPVVHPEQLVYVVRDNRYATVSYPAYGDLRDGNTVFDGIAAWGGITVSLNSDDRAEYVDGAIVTGSFFPTLGVRPALGRLIGPDDDRDVGAHPVVVLSYRLWASRFGGDSAIVGRDLLLDGHAFTVIGVAPRGFGGAELAVTNDMFVPMMMQAVVRPPRGGYAGEMDPDLLQRRGSSWLRIVGRLKPGVSPARAGAMLDGILDGPPSTTAGANRQPLRVSPVDRGDPGDRSTVISAAVLLMSAVGIVLLIACANVANLLLARATVRRREIAVRLSIGAGRRRLVRQLLTESVLLATLGGAAGLLLAMATIGALRRALPPEGTLPLPPDFSIDTHVLLFTLAVSLVAGIAFGLAPALRSSRPDLVPALKDGTGELASRNHRFGARNVLVVAQVALSLVLLVIGGLFLRSLERTASVDPGFEVEHQLTASLNINLLRYTTEQGRLFYRRVVERVAAVPGVASVSLGRTVPLGGGGRTSALLLQRDVAAAASAGQSTDSMYRPVPSNVVGTDYFRTLGMGLLRGRDFTAQDDQGAPPVAIVNAEFVRRFLGGRDALGERMSLHGPDGPWMEIVGVVADSRQRSLAEAPMPMAYVPLWQNHETGMTLQVRTSVDPGVVAAAIGRAIHELEPGLPATGVRRMREWIDLSAFQARALAMLVSVFAATALLLAAIGLYGVLSYAVSRRTRELGLRMALGARRQTVLRQVLREGMTLAGAGTAVGIVLSLGASRLVSGFLYGVSANDVVTFVSVPLLLGVAALAACTVPAWRATRVDPMIALRQQ